MIVKTTCETCGTPIIVTEDNEDKHRLGNKYYCQTHKEKLSPAERSENEFLERKHKIYKEAIQ